MATLGPLWAAFGRSWPLLGRYRAALGRSWDPPAALVPPLAALGPPMAALEALLERHAKNNEISMPKIIDLGTPKPPKMSPKFDNK